MGSCIWTTEGDTAHQYESSDSIIAVRDSLNKVEESEDKSSVEAKHLSRDGNGTNSDNDGAGSLHACVFSTVRLWRTPGQRTERTGSTWPPFPGAGQGYWARQSGFYPSSASRQTGHTPTVSHTQLSRKMETVGTPDIADNTINTEETAYYYPSKIENSKIKTDRVNYTPKLNTLFRSFTRGYNRFSNRLYQPSVIMVP